jgi:ubiquinol-cytochrome c reductase subunit 10
MNTAARIASTLLRRSPVVAIPQIRNASSGATGPGIGMPLGKRQLEQAKLWIPSLATFGATAGVIVVYITDWRVITDYIPFYNGKYKEE